MRRTFVLALVLVAAAARAQPRPPENPAVAEEAKRHFTQAVALYNDGNYNGALAEFEASYQLRPTVPAVLYNIGLTQKALFRYSEAIASLRRYLAEEPRVPPERRAQVEQIVAEMKALLADVTFTVAPDGAQLSLDGRPLGRAPLPTLGIAAGNHVLEVSADGYRPIKRELMVTAGAPLALAVKLEQIPKTARVHVAASRPRALVSVDGKWYGFAPVDVELGAGGHQLEVTATKFLPWRTELVVVPGQPRTVDVTHERASHIYEKWYFWTPLAVVAAGAAIGLGVGLTQREGPIQGTLAPGAGRVN
jgi:hypothetical protein